MRTYGVRDVEENNRLCLVEFAYRFFCSIDLVRVR